MRSVRFVLVFSFLWAGLAAQAKDIVIDLAVQQPGSTFTLPVDPGQSLTVVIVNRVPKLPYDVTVRKVPVPIPELKFPSQAPPTVALTPPCPSETFAAEVQTKKTEADVGALVAADRAAAKGSVCTDAQRAELEALIAKDTTIPLGTHTLGTGEELEVTVNRKDNDKTLTWTFIASTGTPGEWRVSYGFNFIPSRDDNFYLAPSADGKQYTITEARRRDRFAFAPSVYFSFLTNAAQHRCCPIGPVAGLGFDVTTPVVFVGATVQYWQNVSLNLGVVMHQERRLNGKYNTGSVVTENLTDDQLYQKSYVPRFFVGVGFRFDQNPFKKSGGNQ